MSVYRPTYIHTDPATGKRTKRKLRNWYVRYRDADGIVRKVPGYTDREATKALETELQRKAARRQVGMTDPHEEHHKRPLVEHLADYRRCLLAKGDGPRHAALTITRIKAIVDGCRFTRIADIQPSAVQEFLADLRRDKTTSALDPSQEWLPLQEVAQLLNIKRQTVSVLARRHRIPSRREGRITQLHRDGVQALLQRQGQGHGPATVNGYLVSIKGFCKWLVKDRRTADNPLVHLSRLNARTDVRCERRALAEAELRDVLNATEASAATFRELDGRDRAILYATAMTTGFRAGELASLLPSSFELDSVPPTATVEAGYTKNKKLAIQPLPADVADALAGYLAGRPAGQPVWPGTWHLTAAEMIRIDLAVRRHCLPRRSRPRGRLSRLAA